MLVLVGCAETICLVFEESDDFFLIDKIDTHWEDIRIEARRYQLAQVVSQLFFFDLRFLFVESSAMIVFHIGQVLIDVALDRPRKVHVRLLDMCY